MGTYTDKLGEIKALVERLQKEAPEQMEAFHKFMFAVEKPGALDTKAKELVNVGLAVAAQCEWCIALHVKGALDAGAKREEIVDAAMQAVLMHGGPALMYMIPVEKALDEFAAKQ
ncbi:carboxymuconolactone decarboxylase family protein [Hydrogenimonas sp.]|jgi:AhpD family alkylhydroperoxidase|uniref:carboxymuconolactone decarboxylase family protein n=1 Tax=Hydrogenimonas sp. TaxID=2231112 RepID=UPI002619A42C|nr:carboxymuconolactone decarboxylase family protein [Hydrogenimonas sp.]